MRLQRCCCRGGQRSHKRRTLGRGDAESFIDALESRGARQRAAEGVIQPKQNR
jgi:hypothetical protein